MSMKRSVVLALPLALLAAALIGGSVSAAIKVSGYFSYVKKSGLVEANHQAAKKAPCPKGTTVLGGGVLTGGSTMDDEVASTAPYDGPDADRKPDDGWIAEINAGGSDHAMDAHAICAPFTGIKYTRNDFAVPSQDQRRASVGCPETAPKLLGGGILTKGSSTRVAIGESIPGLDGSEVKWFATVNNATSKRVDAVVYAICWKELNLFPMSTLAGNQAPVGQSSVSHQCDVGDHVIGGGARFSIPGPDSELASLIPIDTDDEDSIPDDGWRVWFNNAHFESQEVHVNRACLP